MSGDEDNYADVWNAISALRKEVAQLKEENCELRRMMKRQKLSTNLTRQKSCYSSLSRLGRYNPYK